MSKEESVFRLWDGHWASSTPVAADVLKTRFTREAFEKIRTLIANEDRNILEVGCGTGRFCSLLAHERPDAQVTGIDLSKHALDIAHRLKTELLCSNLSFLEGNLFRLPFRDNCFDVVFSEGVISHFDMEGHSTYVDALAEMTRVTKVGGKVIVLVPNWYCWPHTTYKWLLGRTNVPYEYGYEKSFRQAELVRLFLENGLCATEREGFYPSHGFYRLAHYSRLLGLAGRATDRLERAFDKIYRGWFSRTFGFEVIAVGQKQSNACVRAAA